MTVACMRATGPDCRISVKGSVAPMSTMPVFT